MADAKKADNKDKEKEEKPAKGSSSLVRTMVVIGISVLGPAVLALGLFTFVLHPMLVDAPVEEKKEEVEEEFPKEAKTIQFDEVQATVLTNNADGPAPLLLYQVAMACSDELTLKVVEEKKAWFSSMINKLHRNRTRTELNDPAVQEAILRQAKQEANLLLKKLDPECAGQILEVMHIKYTLVDL